MKNMGEFQQDKQYVFSYRKFLRDTLDTSARWPKLANGQPIKVISEDTGFVYVDLIPGAYPTEFSIVAKWCEESYDFDFEYADKTKEVYEGIKDRLYSKEDKTEFAFVKHENFKGKLNKILNYLQSKGYQICTEVYLKDHVEIRMYSLLHNKHLKIESSGIDNYSVDYYKEIEAR